MTSATKLSSELLSLIFEEAAAPLTSLEGPLRPRIVASGDVLLSSNIDEPYEDVLVSSSSVSLCFPCSTFFILARIHVVPSSAFARIGTPSPYLFCGSTSSFRMENNSNLLNSSPPDLPPLGLCMVVNGTLHPSSSDWTSNHSNRTTSLSKPALSGFRPAPTPHQTRSCLRFDYAS